MAGLAKAAGICCMLEHIASWRLFLRAAIPCGVCKRGHLQHVIESTRVAECPCPAAGDVELACLRGLQFMLARALAAASRCGVALLVFACMPRVGACFPQSSAAAGCGIVPEFGMCFGCVPATKARFLAFIASLRLVMQSSIHHPSTCISRLPFQRTDEICCSSSHTLCPGWTGPASWPFPKQAICNARMKSAYAFCA